jgi:glyoxylase-like metal-dependent hydrolase (beta-lactamase superfamily II)
VPRLADKPVTLTPGIHCLGGLTPAAAYAVETSEGLVLIDAGVEDDARSVKEQLAELGLDWKRIRAVLLTHAHWDHSAGAEHLRKATGARVYAGRDDVDILRAGGPPEALFSTFTNMYRTVHSTQVDVALKDGSAFKLGEVGFRALATPGHSTGSICYVMDRQGLRVLFAGDVLLSLAEVPKPRTRIHNARGTYTAYLAPRYRGDAGAFLATLRQLRDMSVPDLVLPGHPRSDTFPQSPCLSQERWEALLDRGINEMSVLLDRYERDGANFLDGVARKLLPDLYYLGDFQATAVYALLTPSRLFLVDAPGGSGLGAFLDARLRQLGVRTAPLTVLLTSCDPGATAGLRDLVEKRHAEVVAPPDGLKRVEELCPPGTVVHSALDLPGKGWFGVKPIPLKGRGLAPIAYQIRWGPKTLLFSGQMPSPATDHAARRLFADLVSAGSPGDYLTSLETLRGLNPDLWLPSQPENCQNPRLYDEEWQDIIRYNRDLLR